MYDDILYAIDDPVAIITLNRPDRLNAFTYKTLDELKDAVLKAQADPAVVGIVITGAGRGFCAGLDAVTLAESAGPGASRKVAAADPDETPGLFSYLLDVEKPVIAAVNGVAAGGGFVLVALCDIRFAAPEAVFTSVFSKRGLISEHGTSWILPRLLGAGRALDLLWSSRKVGAEEALRIGLVEFVTGSDDLLDQARAYIVDLAENVSPASMRETKRLVYSHMGLGYDPALRETHEAMRASLKRADAKEGVDSFVERRPPDFPRIGGED